jgi:Icc-related predicted phosphoesterase
MRVAGLGDVHAGRTPEQEIRDLFREIAGEADVLALCGDLTNLGKAGEAETLAEELAPCRIPKLAVLGNHDYECGAPDEIMRILGQAGVHFLEDEPTTIAGIGFAGVKGFAGGFDDRMLQAFGEPAIKAFVQETMNEATRLEGSLAALDCEKRVVVLHYAPIAATVVGEPEAIAPFLGSSRLADVIDRFPVSAVLHGHAHHGRYAGKTAKGTPVYNCAATVPKENGKAYALIEV